VKTQSGVRDFKNEGSILIVLYSLPVAAKLA